MSAAIAPAQEIIDTSADVLVSAFKFRQGGLFTLCDFSRDWTSAKTYREGIDSPRPMIGIRLRNKEECREFANVLRTVADALGGKQ
jgi:hypothetical protein